MSVLVLFLPLVSFFHPSVLSLLYSVSICALALSSLPFPHPCIHFPPPSIIIPLVQPISLSLRFPRYTTIFSILSLRFPSFSLAPIDSASLARFLPSSRS